MLYFLVSWFSGKFLKLLPQEFRFLSFDAPNSIPASTPSQTRHSSPSYPSWI